MIQHNFSVVSCNFIFSNYCFPFVFKLANNNPDLICADGISKSILVHVNSEPSIFNGNLPFELFILHSFYSMDLIFSHRSV